VDTGVEGRPYTGLAAMYDELVGQTAFECWRENFERLVNRNGIELDIAADVACGTGLAAGYLARRCAAVYATDISESMLEVARSRPSPGNITFIAQSFTELELPEQVDVLTCNFDSLNYLTEERDLREALRRFSVSVRPGGFAMFDMNTASSLETIPDDTVMFHRTAGGFSIWESAWNPSARINTLRMTNFLRREDGLYSVSEEVHRERAYDLRLVEDALLTAGFSRVESYDASCLTDVTARTRRVQFLARK
jgi:SAM-dependent methyltransferase